MVTRLKYWLPPVLAALACWDVDQWSKSLMLRVLEAQPFGPLSFRIFLNHGLMLGILSDLPQSLRVVGLSTLGAFLLFCAVTTLYFLPLPVIGIRIGIGMVLGGILGNIADRAAYGAVVDFIGVAPFSGVVFNLADVFQWTGYGLILAGAARNYEKLWPSSDLRSRYLVDPRVQLGFAFKVFVASVCFAITLGTLAYTYFKLTLASPELARPEFQRQALMTFIWMVVWVSLGFSAFLFVVSVVSLHAITGPIYAFKRHIHALLRGARPRLKLRQGDQFKELEGLAARLGRHVSPGMARPRRPRQKPRRTG